MSLSDSSKVLSECGHCGTTVAWLPRASGGRVLPFDPEPGPYAREPWLWVRGAGMRPAQAGDPAAAVVRRHQCIHYRHDPLTGRVRAATAQPLPVSAVLTPYVREAAVA